MSPLVFLDLDDTLVDRAAAFRRWAEQFCSDHSLPHAEAAWLEEADREGYTDRVSFFVEACRRFGIADEASPLSGQGLSQPSSNSSPESKQA